MALLGQTYNTDVGGGVGAVGIIIYFAFIALLIVAMWMVFTKAGEAGWKSIIPIYSTIILLKIVGHPWWWILLMLIPFVNIVIIIIVLNDLSKSFGKGAGFTVGLIFLSFIFVPILGFGPATYSGPMGGSSTAMPPPPPMPA